MQGGCIRAKGVVIRQGGCITTTLSEYSQIAECYPFYPSSTTFIRIQTTLARILPRLPKYNHFARTQPLLPEYNHICSSTTTLPEYNHFCPNTTILPEYNYIARIQPLLPEQDHFCPNTTTLPKESLF